jgi:transcriptional regulator with XRE-family HTH domain
MEEPKLRLKEWRLARGFSQPKLSQLSGVHRVTISRLEGGTAKNPTTATMRSLAVALGTDIASLFSSPNLPPLPPSPEELRSEVRALKPEVRRAEAGEMTRAETIQLWADVDAVAQAAARILESELEAHETRGADLAEARKAGDVLERCIRLLERMRDVSRSELTDLQAREARVRRLRENAGARRLEHA